MSNIAYNLEKTSRLSQETREQCHKLFAANYREANHRYLDKSLAQLGNIALAWADGALVGFSLADVLLAPNPGLAGKQHVALGGMGCIGAGLNASSKSPQPHYFNWITGVLKETLGLQARRITIGDAVLLIVSSMLVPIWVLMSAWCS